MVASVALPLLVLALAVELDSASAVLLAVVLSGALPVELALML